jgi:hypothetical protein
MDAIVDSCNSARPGAEIDRPEDLQPDLHSRIDGRLFAFPIIALTAPAAAPIPA